MMKMGMFLPFVLATMIGTGVESSQDDKNKQADKEEEVNFTSVNKTYNDSFHKKQFKSINENLEKIKTLVKDKKEWLETLNLLKEENESFPPYDLANEMILITKRKSADNLKDCKRITQDKDKIRVYVVEHVSNNTKDSLKYISLDFIQIPRIDKQVEFVTMFAIKNIHGKNKYKPDDKDKKLAFDIADAKIEPAENISFPFGAPWIITSDEELKTFLKTNEKAISKPFAEKIDFSKKLLVLIGVSTTNKGCGCNSTVGNVEIIETKETLLINFLSSSFSGGAYHKHKQESVTKTFNAVICDKSDKKILFNITHSHMYAP